MNIFIFIYPLRIQNCEELKKEVIQLKEKIGLLTAQKAKLTEKALQEVNMVPLPHISFISVREVTSSFELHFRA